MYMCFGVGGVSAAQWLWRQYAAGGYCRKRAGI